MQISVKLKYLADGSTGLCHLKAVMLVAAVGTREGHSRISQRVCSSVPPRLRVCGHSPATSGLGGQTHRRSVPAHARQRSRRPARCHRCRHRARVAGEDGCRSPSRRQALWPSHSPRASQHLHRRCHPADHPHPTRLRRHFPAARPLVTSLTRAAVAPIARHPTNTTPAAPDCGTAGQRDRAGAGCEAGGGD